MDTVTLVAVAVAVAALFTAPVLLLVSGAFRTHDPARALAAVEVAPDGRFELAFIAPAGSTVYLRFEIAGADTDGTYDLVATGELTVEGGAGAAFARKTHGASALPGAEGAEVVTTTHAVTMTQGSFALADVPAGRRCVLRGRVLAGAPTRLVRAWAYVPAAG